MKKLWFLLLAFSLCAGAEEERYQLRLRVFPPDSTFFREQAGSVGQAQTGLIPVAGRELANRNSNIVIQVTHDGFLSQSVPIHVNDLWQDKNHLWADRNNIIDWPLDGSEISLQPKPGQGYRVLLYRFREHAPVVIGSLLLAAGALYFGARQKLRARRLQQQQALLDQLARAATSKDDPLVEKQKEIGPYKVVDKLGEGGMAAVYKALPTSTLKAEEAVAIKLMKPELTRDEDQRRFLREIQTVNELRHPNIVRLEAYGETDHDELWMAMELVRGTPLLDRIPERGMSVQETDRYLQPILAGLIYAHGQGVVHRDIKPHNIMIDDSGRVKIMDFGLARSHDASKVTATGTVLGSPDYIPPEQLGGNDLDARSDQYSLGATLYELLCGRPPYHRPDTMATLMAHMTDPVPPLRELAPEVPPSVERVVQRMLEKDPNGRYGDLAAMRDAWNQALRDPNAFSDWRPTERVAAPAPTTAPPKVTAPLDGGDQTLY